MGAILNSCKFVGPILAILGLLLAFPSPSHAQEACTYPNHAECDNGAACTIDTCLPYGFCWHETTCPELPYCDGINMCCTEPGGCDGVELGQCYSTPVTCSGDYFCSNEAGRCVECEVNSDCSPDPCSGLTCITTEPTDYYCYDSGPVDCSYLDGGCEIGVCNHYTGLCETEPVGDGANCDDEDDCTAIDTCQGGVCVGGPADGCVDLEFRIGASGDTVPVGGVVEVDLYAVANDCPPPAVQNCAYGEQDIAGLEVVFTWDPLVLELADSAVTGIPNPDDPCDDVNPCPDPPCPDGTYNWQSSVFPNDCGNDGLNAPCPGFPGNDGDAFYLAFKYESCPGGEDGLPACASSSGLWVTTLKFKALAATAGLSPPTAVATELCAVQKRTLVASGTETGGDILGALGDPVSVVVQCVTDPDCGEGFHCLGGTCGASLPPDVVTEGPRYLAVTPQSGPSEVALFVTGADSDPDVSCVSGWVQENGTLGPDPFYQPAGPGGWDTVHVRDEKLVAGKSYNVQADATPGNPGGSLSQAGSDTLWRWGDVDNDGTVDFNDISRIVDGFRNVFYSTVSCANDGDCTGVRPNYECDIGARWCVRIKLENVDLIGGFGCTPDRVIDFIDISQDVDAFRGIADPCADVCP